jgi:hypothetical protein
MEIQSFAGWERQKMTFGNTGRAQRSSKTGGGGVFEATGLTQISVSCCIDCKIEKRRRELRSTDAHNNVCVDVRVVKIGYRECNYSMRFITFYKNHSKHFLPELNKWQ